MVAAIFMKMILNSDNFNDEVFLVDKKDDDYDCHYRQTRSSGSVTCDYGS